jgi:hypothetical protein
MKVREQFLKCGGGDHGLRRVESVWWLDVAFPLTLTLSLRERGQPLDRFLKFVDRGAEVRIQASQSF